MQVKIFVFLQLPKIQLMKKHIVLLLCLFFTLPLFAGDLVRIPVKDPAEVKQHLLDQNLTVHYCTDDFLIATADLPPACSYETITTNAWSGGWEYFLAYFRPEQKTDYITKISSISSILYTSTDHLILEIQPENGKMLFPAIHNGLVRIVNRPVKIPETSFTFSHDGHSRSVTDPFVTELMTLVNQDSLLATIQHLQDYGTRDCFTQQAFEAQDWIRAKFESYGLQAELMDFEMFGDDASDNVIATLPGTEFPDEYIVLGGHYDSRSWSGQAPGADDNASGIASVLEIARLLSQHDFKRTILFCAWSGEEYGLYGSEAWATWAEQEGLNILGYFNQDMNGYLKPGSEIHTDVMAPASASDLREFYRFVNGMYLPDFEIYNGYLSGGDSDHTSFNNHGFMGIFPFEDSEDYSPEIHTDNDLIGPSVNNIEQCGIFTQSVLASVMTMASMLRGPEDLVGIPANGSVELVWLPLEEAGSYNIYKNDLLSPYINVTGTGFLDTAVENGTSYTYFVTAIYADGGEESFPSNHVTVTPMAPVAFPYMEDFETGAPYWSTEGTWGLSDEVYHSASHSLTDSPNGQYANNLNISATLHTINLAGVTGGTLSFWTKYSLESGYDYAYLEVTTNGTDWTQLASFNGDLVLWQFKEFPLTPYLDQPSVIFRFRLSTDVYLQEDGIYVDDLQIDAWGVGMEEPVTHLQDLRIYPNPFSQSATLEFALERSAHIKIEVLDVNGKKINVLVNGKLPVGHHRLIWDGYTDDHGIAAPGVYTIRISSENEVLSGKIVKLN